MVFRDCRADTRARRQGPSRERRCNHIRLNRVFQRQKAPRVASPRRRSPVQSHCRGGQNKRTQKYTACPFCRSGSYWVYPNPTPQRFPPGVQTSLTKSALILIGRAAFGKQTRRRRRAVFPMASGLNPCGSRTAISSWDVIITIEKAPAKRGHRLFNRFFNRKSVCKRGFW